MLGFHLFPALTMQHAWPAEVKGQRKRGHMLLAWPAKIACCLHGLQRSYAARMACRDHMLHAWPAEVRGQRQRSHAALHGLQSSHAARMAEITLALSFWAMAHGIMARMGKRYHTQ